MLTDSHKQAIPHCRRRLTASEFKFGEFKSGRVKSMKPILLLIVVRVASSRVRVRVRHTNTVSNFIEFIT